MKPLGLTTILNFMFLLSMARTENIFKFVPQQNFLKKSEQHISKEDSHSPLECTWKKFWMSKRNSKIYYKRRNEVSAFSGVQEILSKKHLNSSKNNNNRMNNFSAKYKRNISFDIRKHTKVIKATISTVKGVSLLFPVQNTKNLKLNIKSSDSANTAENLLQTNPSLQECRKLNEVKILHKTALIIAVEDEKIKFRTIVSMKNVTLVSGDAPPITIIKPDHFGGFILEVVKNEIRVHNFQTNFVDNFNHLRVWNISLSDNREDFTNPFLYNLTQTFKCIVSDKNALNISCFNVTLYEIGEYLPNNTVILDLSHSPQKRLIFPLFPHLSKLKSLTLSNNHHKYIIRGFMGLKSLEILDLSNNDIAVVRSSFTYTPLLKTLNLSGNEIIRLGVISNAIITLHKLQNLILDHNIHIDSITRNDTQHLINSNITYMSLFNTSIQYIEKDSFTALPFLKTLEISLLQEKALTNLSCGIPGSLERLYLRQIYNIRNFPEEALNCYYNASVKTIYTHSNFFNRIPKFPSNFRVIWMQDSNASLKESSEFKDIETLEVLFTSYDELLNIPDTVFFLKNIKKLFITYQHRNMNSTFCIGNFTLQNFTHLEELHLTRVRSEGKLLRHNLYGMKCLKLAYLSDINLQVIENFAFETLKSLEILDLKFNRISYLNNFTFYGLRHLKHLDLTKNKIKFHSLYYPFQHSHYLNTLILRDNLIEKLPSSIFLNLKYLKFLILSRNDIFPWNQKILHPNSRITALLLSGNEIDYITDTMLKEFHLVTKTLDLSKNPFNCTKCEMHEFQNFYRKSNLSWRFPVSKQDELDYRCVEPQSPRNITFAEVHLPGLSCEQSALLIMIRRLWILSSTFIITVIFCICYAFRWYVKYCFFHLKTNFIIHKGRTSTEKIFIYDAFVVYNSTDNPWVKNYLIPKLEQQEPKYRLCIHERDFKIGNLITQNIYEAIESSRNVILILSENFIKSNWCKYELHLAQHKLFRDARDSLLLIKMKNINKKLYTKNIAYLEKTRKYFMWSDCPIKQETFWNDIRKELGQPETYRNLEIY